MDILDIGAAYKKALGGAKDYTDTRIDSIIPGFDYKGSIATVEDLPATGNTKGDCYNVEDGSGVYVWDGDSWGSASKVGPTGEDGDSAGFGTPTATVDANIGTPSVTITASGPDTQKIFNFEFHNLKGQQGASGSNAVSVSATGTSTNDVRYITIDGAESRFTSVALKAMKNAWKGNITTAEAATAILNDESVVQGDGFLATVYWTDLPGNRSQAEVKAFVMKKEGYQKIVQFECTSGDTAPYAWFYNSYDSSHMWRAYIPLDNTVTSTSTTSALTANMGKSLQDQITDVKSKYVEMKKYTGSETSYENNVLYYTVES